MLTRYEKFAVFNLCIVLCAVLLFLLLLGPIGFTGAQSAFGIIGFIGIGHLLFLRKRNSSDIVEDERDTAIKLKASGIGYYISMAYFIIASLSVYYSQSGTGVISVELLPFFAWIGWAVYIVSSSVIALILYRQGVACGTC